MHPEANQVCSLAQKVMRMIPEFEEQSQGGGAASVQTSSTF
jgi:hypothetical protein